MIAEEYWVEISRKMDLRVEPLEHEIKQLRLKMENDYLPRLETIESVYTSTYERYVNQLEKQDRILDDIDVMKKVLMHHSEQLEAINRTLDEHNRKFDTIDKRFDELTDLVTKNSRLIEKNSSLIEENSSLTVKLIDIVEKLSQQINVNYN